MKIGCLDKFTESEIRTTIRNCVGLRGGLFIPDQSFEVMIKRAIRSLDDPCRECVQNVFEELATIISFVVTVCHVITFVVALRRRRPLASPLCTLAFKKHRAPCLCDVLSPPRSWFVVNVLFLRHCIQVSTLIKMETSRINTAHPAFVGSRTAVSGLMADIKRDIAAKKLPTDQAIQEKEVSKSATSSASTAPPASPAPSATPAPAAAVPATASAPPPVPPPVMNRTGSTRGVGGPPPPPPSIRKPRTTTEEPFSEQDAIEAEVIRRLLTSYFDIVKIKIMDSVPKAVSLTLVSRVREELHDALVAGLYREDQIDTLLDENAEVASRRKRLRDVIALLEISQKAISEVQASALG